MFDDGSKPSTDIRVERVCNGSPHLESHVDSRGQFSFQLGQNPAASTDASDGGAGWGNGGNTGYGLGQSNSASGNSSFGSSLSGNRNTGLWGCDLRAAYPGYRSDEINLSMSKEMDNPDVGTIILHRLGNVQGTTLSLTSALAPKRAQKDYEKGMQLAQKGKLEEAEKHLTDATTEYPKYATAWFALGQVEQKERNTEAASKSYQAAIAADPKYVSPYDQLALLAAQATKWNDAADYSKRAIELNPVEFPSSFWYNALANYHLKKPEEEEKSLKAIIKLDTAHHYPESEDLYGQMLLAEGKYPEAATHLRAYLAIAPPGSKNTESVKQALVKLDQANVEAKK